MHIEGAGQSQTSLNTTVKRERETVSGSQMKANMPQPHVRVDNEIGKEAVDELNDLFDEI